MKIYIKGTFGRKLSKTKISICSFIYKLVIYKHILISVIYKQNTYRNPIA